MALRGLTRQRLSRLVRSLLGSNVLVGFLLTVLSWPYDAGALMPQPGFDPGWSAALEMLAARRLPFGTHAVFAYGPLGFFAVWPIYYTWTGIFGFLFLVALYTTLFAVLVWCLRRVLPLLVAVVVAFVAGTVSVNVVSQLFTGEPEKALALTVVGCVYALSRPVDSPAPRRFWLLFGFAIAVFGLLKMSIGVGMVLAFIITIVCLPSGRRQAARWTAVSALVTGAVAWFATGNGFGNIASFARGTASIISGYGAAVSIEAPGRGYTYWLAAAEIALIAGLAAAYSWRIGRRAQAGIGLVTLFLTWQLFKEAFVRHDLYHDPVFFTAAPLLVVAFTPLRREWRSGVAVVAGVLATTMVAGLVSNFPVELTRPGSAAVDFANEVTTLVSPGQRSQNIAMARAVLQEDYYALPRSMVAAMRGHTVDVDPWEQSVVWAYPGFVFDPLPGLQGYSTYTTSLDQLDVDYLRSPEAPKYILRQSPAAPDGRDPTFEPPATQIAIECRYREV